MNVGHIFVVFLIHIWCQLWHIVILEVGVVIPSESLYFFFHLINNNMRLRHTCHFVLSIVLFGSFLSAKIVRDHFFQKISSCCAFMKIASVIENAPIIWGFFCLFIFIYLFFFNFFFGVKVKQCYLSF